MYLRQFKGNEAVEISSWFSTYKEAILWGGRVFSWPIAANEIIKRSLQQEIEFFTLSEGDEIFGFIELQHIGLTEMRLCRVAVSPKYRGQGLGKTLVRLSIAEIQQRNQYQIVSLAVFTQNITAHNCYRSLGFVAVDKEPKFKQVGGESWPLIQMEMAL